MGLWFIIEKKIIIIRIGMWLIERVVGSLIQIGDSLVWLYANGKA